MTENVLRKSGDSPVERTIADKKSVKSEKLMIKPVTIPIGLLCPPFKDPERTIGSTGSMQGERIVTKPATKANKISKSINKDYTC